MPLNPMENPMENPIKPPFSYGFPMVFPWIGGFLLEPGQTGSRYTCANDLSTRDWQKVPELSGSWARPAWKLRETGTEFGKYDDLLEKNMENMMIYWKYMGNMVIYGCLPSGNLLQFANWKPWPLK